MANKRPNFFQKRKMKELEVEKKAVVTEELDLSIDPEALIELALQTAPEKQTEAVVPIVAESPSEIKVEKLVDKGIVIAYNVHYNTKYKKFMLISLEVNPDTGFSKIVSNEPFADSWAVAISKLRNIIALKLAKGTERR